MKQAFLWLLVFLLGGCMGVPENVRIVENVDASRYLGKWYEIARLDHTFERGLEQVTATYSQKENGSIKVINRGFNTEKKVWKEAEGKAYFIDPANADGSRTGKLKVSFFGPFYGAYNIIELDKTDYRYVMICGPDKSYLWILSRTPQLDDTVKQTLVAKAKSLGFATDKLIFVTH